MKVFTGKAPFFENVAPTAIMSIMNGKRPERPSHASFTDCLWELTEKCLEQTPSDRPKVGQVLEVLKKQSVYSHLDSVHFTHRSSLGRANRTAFISATPPGESSGQVYPPTALCSTPATRGIPSKTRAGGGGRDSPDQLDAQPLQTLKGETSCGSVHTPLLRANHLI